MIRKMPGVTTLWSRWPFKTKKSMLKIEASDASSQPQPMEKTRPPAQLGSFSRIPPELVYQIMHHLDNVSEVLFALTCRTLFRYWIPSNQKLGYYDKMHLQRLLANTYPEYVYSDDAPGLVRWADYSPPRSPGLLPQYQRDGTRVSEWTILCQMPLYLERAMMVMRRHRYGPGWGPEPEVLDLDPQWSEPDKNNVRTCTLRRARVVKGELLVAHNMKFKVDRGKVIPKGYDWTLKARVDICLCKDRWYINGQCDRDGPTLKVAFKPESCYKQKWKCIVRDDIDLSGKCATCFTDYQLNINWLGPERGWEAEVSAYHNLGSLESLLDVKWQSISDRLSRRVWFKQGSIRKAWLSGGPDIGDLAREGATKRSRLSILSSLLHRKDWAENWKDDCG